MADPTMETILQVLGDFNVRLCNLESHVMLLAEKLKPPVPAAEPPAEEDIIKRMEYTGETWEEAVRNFSNPVRRREDNADETEGAFHVPI